MYVLSQLKSNNYYISWVCFCSLSYRACKGMLVLYCLSSVSCPAVHCFSTLYQKRHDFREKKVIKYKIIFDFCTTFSKSFPILRRIQRDIVINVKHLYVNYPFFLCCFNEILIFFTDLRKILEYQISWKSMKWQSSCSKRTDRLD